MSTLLLILSTVGGLVLTQEPKQLPARPRVTLGVAVEASAEGEAAGLTVREVSEDSPAAKAGIKPGDVIARVGDKEVRDYQGLVTELNRHKPGDSVPFQVRRDGKDQKLTVTLAGRKPERPTNPVEQPPRPARGAFLGVQARAVDDELKQRFNLTADSGVVIAEVVAGSPAERAKLREGDLILQVNGQAVSGPEELREAVQKTGAGKELRLQVQRDNKKVDVTARLEAPPQDQVLPIPFPAIGERVPGVPPMLFEGNSRVQALEKRIKELEKRVQELEKKQGVKK